MNIQERKAYLDAQDEARAASNRARVNALLKSGYALFGLFEAVKPLREAVVPMLEVGIAVSVQEVPFLGGWMVSIPAEIDQHRLLDWLCPSNKQMVVVA
jgi:hypothetical protein